MVRMEEAMNQMARFGIVLGVICLLSTLVLAVTYDATKPVIEREIKREEEKAFKAVIPGADSFTEKTLDGIEYVEARGGGELVGYCIRTVASGYEGPIRLIVGIDPNGRILGLEVLEHSETPGLGAKMKEIRPGETEPYFLRQFKGKDARNIKAKKNIDAITGATITTRAITNEVCVTVDEFLSKLGK